jgi:hypothetical protein
MKFDIDVWWRQRKADHRAARRERLNATCPSCGRDLLML